MKGVLQDIIRAHPWQALARQASLTISGGDFDDTFNPDDFESATELVLPDDFGYLKSDVQFWTNGQLFPMRQILSQDEWMQLTESSFGNAWIGPYPIWIRYGDKLYIRPQPAGTVKVSFIYQSRNAVRDVGGNLSLSVSNDSDEFLIPDRLVRLGMLWRFKELTGQSYAEALQQYQTSLAQEIMRDGAPGLIVVGRRRRHDLSVGATYAWPFPIAP